MSEAEIERISQRSQAIASTLTTKQLLIPSSRSLAETPLEKSAESFYRRLTPAPLSLELWPEQRRLMFRGYYVPIFCRIVIAWFEKDEKPLYWLWEHATYVLAFERMLMEMHFRRGKPKKSKSVEELFHNPPEGHTFWLARFDEWRSAACASYRLFIRKQCPGISESKEPNAANLATLSRLSEGLPETLFAAEMSKVRSDAEMRIFKKALNRIKPPRWGEPELETWLIEIWPLVTEYDWNYFDVWQAAVKRGDDTSKGPLDSCAKLKDRCKDMGLQLSPKGAERQGRQTGRKPPFADIALWIEPIGLSEQNWIGSKFFKP